MSAGEAGAAKAVAPDIAPETEGAAFETWVRDAALPFWAERARDPSGAFYERLTMDGAPDEAAPRRVRVQFRQIYVYAAASILGVFPGGDRIAAEVFDRVRALAWAPDGRPGWAHLLDGSGAVLDPTRDAYDQAFALMALAWLHRTGRHPDSRAAIDATVDFVDGWIAARSGGWWEAAGADASGLDLRRQNPHMHALEAMMALYEATGERAFLDRARELYHLFAGRFYDWPRSIVVEYFDADWRPAPATRQRVEPGHMAEWVFLIREYERLTGDPVDAIANPLFDKARSIGRDPSGRFLVDELDLDARPTKPTRRLWPQTEHVKAALTQYRVSGDARFQTIAAEALAALRAEYLSGCPNGGWRDVFDLSGASQATHMPTSSLYHIFGAYALSRELLGRRPRGERPAAFQETAVMTSTTQRLITPVVLAGGVGSRLWPLSTREKPKQFLPLTGRRTLLQETLSRVAEPALFGAPQLVCHADYGALAAEQAAEIDRPFDRVVLEPEPKNSAPAIVAAALLAAEEDPDVLLLVLPADHMIRETSLFHRLVENAAAAARRGAIVTFGITPARPETGYGYIKAGAPIGVAGAFEVDAFVEKPDLATARAYLASGSYLWNSGMFLFRARDFIEEARTRAPEILNAVSAAVEAATRAGAEVRLDPAAFAATPSDSIDYAIMEATDRAAVCPAALTWSDIGSWDALAMVEAGDDAGNAAIGRASLMECEGVYARSDGPRVAAIGLENVVIVATDDTVLITSKDHAQKVKAMAERVARDEAGAADD